MNQPSQLAPLVLGVAIVAFCIGAVLGSAAERIRDGWETSRPQFQLGFAPVAPKEVR